MYLQELYIYHSIYFFFVEGEMRKPRELLIMRDILASQNLKKLIKDNNNKQNDKQICKRSLNTPN
jgi:hypothetical protein